MLKEKYLKKRKSTSIATEICDENGLPDRSVFWKIKGNIKKWLLVLRPSLWSKIVRRSFSYWWNI